MMSTLTATGHGSDAFSLLLNMLSEGVTPDRITVSTVLGYGTTSLHPFAIKLGLHKAVHFEYKCSIELLTNTLYTEVALTTRPWT